MSSLYTIGNGGSDIPQSPREFRENNSLRIERACLEWLSSITFRKCAWVQLSSERVKMPLADTRADWCEEATSLLKGLVASSNDAHTLVVSPRVMDHENSIYLGLFMSTIYALSQERIIVHNTYSPSVHFIGYRNVGLLINTGHAGAYFGMKSKGISINVGEVGPRACFYAQGIAMNAGTPTKGFCRNSNAQVINLHRKHYGKSKTRFHTVSEHDRQYLQDLIASARNNPYDLERCFGGYEVIQQKMRKMVR